MAEELYTIGDWLTASGLKPTQRGYKRIIEAGFSVDEPYSALNDVERLARLAPDDLGATESDFKNYLKGQNRLAEAALLDHNTTIVNIFGQKGVARSSRLKDIIPAASQDRTKTAAFDAIPEAKETLPRITKAIAEIPDPDIRAAVAFNALVPLRVGEVAGLSIDDIDFKTGGFSYVDDRGTKVRAKMPLPDVALAILEEQAKKARANGHTQLFYDERKIKKSTTFRDLMTKEINKEGGLKTLMAEFEDVMGRKIKGASDFRKIVPSLIAMELGFKGQVSAIMGHTKTSDLLDEMESITKQFYVSKVVKIGAQKAQETPELIALKGLQNAYARVLNLPSVNALAGSFNLDLPRLSAKGAPKILVADEGQSVSEKDTNKGTMDDGDLTDLEDRRKLAKEKLETDIAKATSEKIVAQTAVAEQLADPETRAKLVEGEKQQIILEEEKKSIRAEAKAQIQAEKDAAKGPTEFPDDVKSAFNSLGNFFDSIGKVGKKALVAVGAPGMGYLDTESRVETLEKAGYVGDLPEQYVKQDIGLKEGPLGVAEVVGEGIQAGMEQLGIRESMTQEEKNQKQVKAFETQLFNMGIDPESIKAR